MKADLYDVVLLRNGLKAQVVEILANGECYVVDVEEAHGWEEDDTIFALREEVIANFKTWREADRFRYIADIYVLELPDKSKAFTHLVLEERTPDSHWRKVIVNSSEHKPVYTSLNRDDIVVIEGIHNYAGMTVEFV